MRVVFSYFASLSLITFNKNAGICCCFINWQPACFSLFFVRYELACVRLDYVSICSLGLQWFLNSALLSPVPCLLESIETAIFSNKRELK